MPSLEVKQVADTLRSLGGPLREEGAYYMEASALPGLIFIEDISRWKLLAAGLTRLALITGETGDVRRRKE